MRSSVLSICFKTAMSILVLTFFGCDAINSYQLKKINEDFDDECLIDSFIIIDIALKNNNAEYFQSEHWLILNLLYYDLCWNNKYKPKYERKWFHVP